MALVLKDRVRETSTSTGTGTITLAGAVTGFQSFSVIGSGNTTYYTISDQSSGNWEVGLGTYTAPNQLARTTVLESSNANALVNFGAGTKDVFVTFPAEGFASPPAIGSTTPNSIRSTTLTVDSTADIYGSTAVRGGNLTVISNASSGAAGQKITLDNTYLGGQTLNIADDQYFTGVSFTATGSYGAVFYSPVTLVESTGIEGVSVKASPTTTSYSFTLPDTAGSNNNILQTDGSGNTSWMDLGSPPAIGGTTPNTVNATSYSAVGVNGTPILRIDSYDGGDGFDYWRIYGDDGSGPDPLYAYGIYFPGGLTTGKTFTASGLSSVPYSGSPGFGGALSLVNEAGGQFRFYPDNTHTSIIELYWPSALGSNNQVLKTDGSGNLSWIYPAGQGNAPVTFTTTTYTVAATDIYIIGNCNTGNMTITLPAASTNSGRVLTIKTTQNRTVVSFSSNVVPLNGGAAGTAILSGVAGRFAQLVSDGTNWIIMQAN